MASRPAAVGGRMIPTLEFKDGLLYLLDQTKLPRQISMIACRDHHETARAIKDMIVRGAPAIGVAAAYGAALGVMTLDNTLTRDAFMGEFEGIMTMLLNTRPTAVNLYSALARLRDALLAAPSGDVPALKALALSQARAMEEEDVAACRAIGRHGAALIPHGATILTHCNAGALATCGYGTALGVIRAAHEAGKKVQVFADETRPYLQGARLTAFELAEDGIPVTLICDNMAGHFMHQGIIQCVVVGADRIAANGDTANKIGTYSLAVLAREHNIPFYVAAPTSTIDLATADGEGIPIEERSAREVTHFQGIAIAHEGIKVRHPAFDVTPHRYISAIITEKGVVRAPFAAHFTK